MLTLSLLPETLAICRLERDALIPSWAQASSFFSMTRTENELSIVCPQECVPEGTRCNTDWKCFRIEGPIEFSAVGVLASFVEPLAKANVSVFVICTFETDYLMVKKKDVGRAARGLSSAGHRIRELVITTP